VEMDCERLCSITDVTLTDTVTREGSKMAVCPSVVYKETNRPIIFSKLILTYVWLLQSEFFIRLTSEHRCINPVISAEPNRNGKTLQVQGHVFPFM
jgi:hypothetical protein